MTLVSRDGSVSLSGDLLSFDGEYYRLSTIYGVLTVDGSGVNCSGPGCPDLENFVAELRISGQHDVSLLLVQNLLVAFAAENDLVSQVESTAPELRAITLIDEGSGKIVARWALARRVDSEAFDDLLEARADIALVHRQITENENERFMQAELGDLSRPHRNTQIALLPYVPMIAPENPVSRLSRSQLQQIYRGEILRWAELGGPDAPIFLHLLRGDSFPTAQFTQADAPEAAVFHQSYQDLQEAVILDPFALALAPSPNVSGVKALPLAGSCGFDLHATRQNVKTKDYPLTTSIFGYVTDRKLPKHAQRFFDFLTSDKAAEVVRGAGYVDLLPEEVGIDNQGQRLINAIRASKAESAIEDLHRVADVLGNYRRVTLSFRFETGSSRLDFASELNAKSFAKALEAGDYDGKELLIAGFSDGEGAAESNLKISRERAETVKAAILNFAQTLETDQTELQVEGFGEALPMACDDTDWGRQANRRVEIWVR